MSTAATLDMGHTQLYINHEWVDGSAGGSLEVINPATEETIVAVAYGTQADARRALEAAQAALPAWRKLTAYDRAGKLKKIADLMRERADDLATAMTMEQGKPLGEAKAEASGATSS